MRTKTVSANDAKNRFGSLIGYVSDEDGEVIIENRGKPKAVIISMEAYKEVQDLREHKRQEDALERLRALHARIAARNQDLTEDEAIEIADRVSHELVEDMAARGELASERGTP